MFVGRESELSQLEAMYQENRFHLVIVYGRRRVGKTTLIRHFIQNKRALIFSAEEASESFNLQLFAKKLREFFNIAPMIPNFTTWREALEYVSYMAKKECFILVLDEYPYLAQRTEFFNSMLQHLIDYEFKKTNLFLILCGSQISFMEEEVLGAKSPLFGRRTSQFEIKPFNYFETAKFLKNFSNEDKVKFYATFGGTPYYLEQINVTQSYEDNVKRLFLQTGGYLYEEPMMLLCQELKETAIYNTIITAIASGASKIGEIVSESGFRDSRQVSPYLDKLVKLRLVNKVMPFGENMKKTRNKRYVLADHFFAFWFQYIFSNRGSVEDQLGEVIFQKDIAPDLNRFIGQFAFEEICLSYMSELNRRMELPFLSSVKGSWWGTDKNQQTGSNQTDIDVVMADKSERKIILGECKWKNQLNDVADISKLLEKKRLLPRYQEYYFYFFSKIPYSLAAYKLAEENDHLKLIELDDLYKF